jgi:putative thiamine transport system substrate-binding protein
MLTRRSLLKFSAASSLLPFCIGGAWAAEWTAVVGQAKGQDVYFNAWAGADTINAYIAWVGQRVQALYGVNLIHVKITDTAEVVKRVRDEVKAGQKNGSVDLVWINGENFRVMKSEGLLFGPFAEALPNFSLVDVVGKPTIQQDFTEKVGGLESPWGMAQFTFFGDGAKISFPPNNLSCTTRFSWHYIFKTSYAGNNFRTQRVCKANKQ